MGNNKFNFNQKKLDALPYASKGQRDIYYDASTPGLALRITETSKTFFVSGRIKNGESTRYTLGKYPQINLEKARVQVSIIQNKLNQGINPNDEKNEVILEKKALKTNDTETLEWLFDKYVLEHLGEGGKVKVKTTTLDDIKISLKAFSQRRLTTLKINKAGVWEIDKVVEIEDWLSRPYREISNIEILDRFKTFSISLRENHGNVIKPIERTHQLAFRYLRAIYNFIIQRALIEDANNKKNLLNNPVEIISVYKLWKNPPPRKNKLDTNEFEYYNWWKSLNEYGDNLAKDYIFVSLFQAGRSADVAPLKFENLDFKQKVINYKDTKNGEDYVFPMTEKVYAILKKRQDLTSEYGKYVFEYSDSKFGYIPKGARWHFEKLAEKSGKKITHHDLRRTWTSVAVKVKVNPITMNFCLKHLIQDVNKHYITVDVEVLREALQQVEDYFFTQYSLFENQKLDKE